MLSTPQENANSKTGQSQVFLAKKQPSVRKITQLIELCYSKTLVFRVPLHGKSLTQAINFRIFKSTELSGRSEIASKSFQIVNLKLEILEIETVNFQGFLLSSFHPQYRSLCCKNFLLGSIRMDGRYVQQRIDALQQSGRSLKAYTFPPFLLNGRLFRKSIQVWLQSS